MALCCINRERALNRLHPLPEKIQPNGAGFHGVGWVRWKTRGPASCPIELLLRPAFCLLLSAFCLLPSAYCLLPGWW
ncbi:MAG: hypothetical protein DMF70_12590 [Acidobacteria bacterium]|nr:MAG: hypothetical protein DMF70_12590 [Acidobacteriota bacterium]